MQAVSPLPNNHIHMDPVPAPPEGLGPAGWAHRAPQAAMGWLLYSELVFMGGSGVWGPGVWGAVSEVA